ncbi:MAG: hypothetical protein HY295_01510 [Thaumarchaeota archaeon]|nr:hypothetical protein [Nitrososphaerota archaeon]
MQTNLEKLQRQKFLLFSLIAIGIALLVATSFGEEASTLVTDFASVLAAGIASVLALIISIRYGIIGNHGKAWIIFTASMVSWFLGELVWTINELIYHINPFPSSSDFFYFLGYPFMFAFSIFYIRPLRRAISRKMVLVPLAISAVLIIPTTIMAYHFNTDKSQFEMILGIGYPVLDALLLCPALIGVALFFRGEVNFLWTLLLIGIISTVVGDTGFLFATITDTYYTGHPSDIPLIWAYVFYSFGVYSHILIFKKPPQKTHRIDWEDLR